MEAHFRIDDSQTGPDRFGPGERVTVVKDGLSPVDKHPLALCGDTGTIIFKEPLSSRELYHVELDSPRDPLYRQMLFTPNYLEPEA